MLAWRSHVEGAALLIKSRGKEQLKTGIGRQLFNAVRHSLVGASPPYESLARKLTALLDRTNSLLRHYPDYGS